MQRLRTFSQGMAWSIYPRLDRCGPILCMTHVEGIHLSGPRSLSISDTCLDPTLRSAWRSCRHGASADDVSGPSRRAMSAPVLSVPGRRRVGVVRTTTPGLHVHVWGSGDRVALLLYGQFGDGLMWWEVAPGDRVSGLPGYRTGPSRPWPVPGGPEGHARFDSGRCAQRVPFGGGRCRPIPRRNRPGHGTAAWVSPRPSMSTLGADVRQIPGAGHTVW